MVFGKEVKVDDLEAARNKTTENSQLVNAAELEAVDNYFLKVRVNHRIFRSFDFLNLMLGWEPVSIITHFKT